MLILPPRDASRPSSLRSGAAVAVSVLVGVLISLAGKHALEARLGEWPAIVVSHGAGLLVLYIVLRLGLRRWPPRRVTGER